MHTWKKAHIISNISSELESPLKLTVFVNSTIENEQCGLPPSTSTFNPWLSPRFNSPWFEILSTDSVDDETILKFTSVAEAFPDKPLSPVDDAIITAAAADDAETVLLGVAVYAITADDAATPVKAPPQLVVQDIPPPLLVLMSNGPINSRKKDDGKLAIMAAMRKGTNRRILCSCWCPHCNLSLLYFVSCLSCGPHFGLRCTSLAFWDKLLSLKTVWTNWEFAGRREGRGEGQTKNLRYVSQLHHKSQESFGARARAKRKLRARRSNPQGKIIASKIKVIISTKSKSFQCQWNRCQWQGLIHSINSK